MASWERRGRKWHDWLVGGEIFVRSIEAFRRPNTAVLTAIQLAGFSALGRTMRNCVLLSLPSSKAAIPERWQRILKDKGGERVNQSKFIRWQRAAEKHSNREYVQLATGW